MRIDCPFENWPDAWIETPDEWTGEHANKWDEALRLGHEAKLPHTWRTFSCATAVLTDWGNIPGMNGNPDKWDFVKMKLPIVAWINDVLTTEYGRNFVIPKKKQSSSPESLLKSEMMTSAADGT